MKKILCFALVMITLMSVFSFSTFAVEDTESIYEGYVPNPENKYESYVVQKAVENQDLFIEYYNEIYEYFPDGVASTDEEMPKYVLISLSANLRLNAPTGNVLGDYAFYSMSMGYPFVYGYGIYIPETGEVMGLEGAYELGIEGIEKVFTEAGIGRLMGDMDKDRRLSIKDATYIQKCIAGFEGYSADGIYAARFDEFLPCAIADFNRDRTVSVKDATAIQKYVAGIVEE